MGWSDHLSSPKRRWVVSALDFRALSWWAAFQMCFLCCSSHDLAKVLCLLSAVYVSKYWHELSLSSCRFLSSYSPGTLWFQTPTNAVPCPQNTTCAFVPTCSNSHSVVLRNVCCSVEPSFLCFADCSASFLSVRLLTLHPINMTSEPHFLRNGNHSKYFVVCAKWVGGLNSVAFRQVFAYIPKDHS